MIIVIYRTVFKKCRIAYAGLPSSFSRVVVKRLFYVNCDHLFVKTWS